MSSVLMLDRDARLTAAVTRALSHQDVIVFSAASVSEALDQVALRAFDAAILDADLLDSEELAAFLPVPVILTTSFLEPAGAQRAFSDAPLLRKPFTSAQLLSALHEVGGGLHAQPERLVDVLRHAHSEKRTIAIEVAGARVFVEAGELVHAEFADSVGESALAEALAQSDVRPVIVPGRKVERTIDRPFRALMLEMLRNIEEREGHSAADAERGSRS